MRSTGFSRPLDGTARCLRALLGTVFWLALGAAAAGLLTARRSTGTSTAADLRRHLLGREVQFDIEFPAPVVLEVGDTVLLERDGTLAGEVCALLDRDGEPLPHLYGSVQAARLRIFDGEAVRLTRKARVRLVRAPDTALWAVHTLLAPEKLPRVQEEWSRSWPSIQAEIERGLKPFVEDVLRDSQELVAAEAGPFLARHRDLAAQVLRTLEEELDDRELAEIFEAHVWPLVKKHLQPVSDRIGGELWERVPLWGLTWRLVFQSLPLTPDDYFARRWDEFVAGEVMPILKSHAEEIVVASREITREALADERIRTELRRAALRLLNDPGLHQLVRLFLREVFLESPRFQQIVEEHWNASEVQRSVSRITADLEVLARRLADILLGTREAGISQEFARVLRAQILEKDARRVFLDPGAQDEPPLAEGARLAAAVEWEKTTLGAPAGRP